MTSTQIFFFQIELFPILLLSFLLFHIKGKLPFTETRTRLFELIILALAANITELLCWLFNGVPGAWIHGLLWVTNAGYNLIIYTMFYSWYMFNISLLHPNEVSYKRYKLIWIIPSVLCVGLMMLNIRSVFTISTDNMYERGPLIMLQFAYCFLLLLIPSVLCFRRAVIEKNKALRREFLYAASFCVLPFIGGMLQAILYGTDFIDPFIAASVTMIYMSQIHKQIYVDALTGLNNRGRFNAYIHERCTDKPASPFELIMIDVDHFKQINDRFGHALGDRALKETAEMLKKSFGTTNSFIARYGGDEFVIVLNETNALYIQKLLFLLDEEIKATSIEGMPKGSVTLSLGMSRFFPEAPVSPETLIAMADKNMYKIKAGHKNSN